MILLDSVVAFLLVATIVYCWQLSRKISELKDGRRELMQVMREFNQYIRRAQETTAALKEVAYANEEELRERIEKARFLCNDLAFLIHKGEGIADQLEQAAAARSAMAKTVPFIPQQAGALAKPEQPAEKRQALEEVLTQISSKRDRIVGPAIRSVGAMFSRAPAKSESAPGAGTAKTAEREPLVLRATQRLGS